MIMLGSSNIFGVGKNLTAGGDPGYTSGSKWGNWITDVSSAISNIIGAAKGQSGMTTYGPVDGSGRILPEDENSVTGGFQLTKNMLWVGAAILVLVLVLFIAPLRK